MRRNSLTSMLGEFIGLQKTPDFRLSSVSNTEINQAVTEEKRSYSFRMRDEGSIRKPRQRYLSEGDISMPHPHTPPSLMRISSNPDGGDAVDVVMRVKTTVRKEQRQQRPRSLFDRIRRKISASKNEAIIESDEERNASDETAYHNRRASTVSERLFIHITPVVTPPIRVLQVSN